MSEVKTVLITGATGGLGQSIANEFYELKGIVRKKIKISLKIKDEIFAL